MFVLMPKLIADDWPFLSAAPWHTHTHTHTHTHSRLLYPLQRWVIKRHNIDPVISNFTAVNMLLVSLPWFSAPVWKVARYTSAAPMFFTEFEDYVDGGVLANNPCSYGLSAIQNFYRWYQIQCRILKFHKSIQTTWAETGHSSCSVSGIWDFSCGGPWQDGCSGVSLFWETLVEGWPCYQSKSQKSYYSAYNCCKIQFLLMWIL